MSRPRDAALSLLAPVFDRAGHAYLAGRDRDDALQVARRLLDGGHGVTVGYWNDGDDPAEQVAAESAACVAALAGDPRAQVAVKAPALDFDPDRVRRLAAAAAAADVALLFDAHAPDQADATIALAEAARTAGARSGIAVATRWQRSAADARAATQAGLSVRLVKGQWKDDVPGGIPGIAGDRQLRGAFLGVLDQVDRPARPVTIATHDVVLFAAAVRRAREAGLPCELELLLGLPARRLLALARREQVPVRFYVPYGHPSLSYSLSSTVRRPRLAVSLAQGVLLGTANRPVRLREALRR